METLKNWVPNNKGVLENANFPNVGIIVLESTTYATKGRVIDTTLYVVEYQSPDMRGKMRYRVNTEAEALLIAKNMLP
jgi:hypothetical protein